MTRTTGNRAGTHQGAGPVLPQPDDHEWGESVSARSTTPARYHRTTIATRDTPPTQIGPRSKAEPDQVSQVKRLGQAEVVEAQHAKHTTNKSGGEAKRAPQLAADETRIA
jgi:hypothetical protein